VRALIDFWFERLDTPRGASVPIEDIPID
jgi:hypothetical protein